MSEQQKIRRFNKPLRYPAVIKTDKFSKNRAVDNFVKIYFRLYILCVPYLFHVHILPD